MAATTDTVTRTVRAHLDATGRSQGWLARRARVTAHWLSRRMTGKQAWTTDDIDRIADALGVDAFSILAGIAPEPAAVAA